MAGTTRKIARGDGTSTLKTSEGEGRGLFGNGFTVANLENRVRLMNESTSNCLFQTSEICRARTGSCSPLPPPTQPEGASKVHPRKNAVRTTTCAPIACTYTCFEETKLSIIIYNGSRILPVGNHRPRELLRNNTHIESP